MSRDNKNPEFFIYNAANMPNNKYQNVHLHTYQANVKCEIIQKNATNTYQF